jgi:hypothetical protein
MVLFMLPNNINQNPYPLIVERSGSALVGVFMIRALLLLGCKGDKGGGPEVEPGTVDAKISGSINLDVSGGRAEYVDSTVLISPGVVTQADYLYMTWRKDDKKIITAFTYGESEADNTVEEIEPGTYTPDGETEFVEVTLQLDSAIYEMTGGAVRLTKVKESAIEGNYKDVVLEQQGSAKDSLRLEGMFQAIEKE